MNAQFSQICRRGQAWPSRYIQWHFYFASNFFDRFRVDKTRNKETVGSCRKVPRSPADCLSYSISFRNKTPEVDVSARIDKKIDVKIARRPPHTFNFCL